MGPSFFARDEHGIHVIGVDASLFGSGFAREHDQWKFLELGAREDQQHAEDFVHALSALRDERDRSGRRILTGNVEPEQRASAC